MLLCTKVLPEDPATLCSLARTISLESARQHSERRILRLLPLIQALQNIVDNCRIDDPFRAPVLENLRVHELVIFRRHVARTRCHWEGARTHLTRAHEVEGSIALLGDDEVDDRIHVSCDILDVAWCRGARTRQRRRTRR